MTGCHTGLHRVRDRLTLAVMDKLMTARDVMAAVRLSRATIYNLLAAGEFPRPVRIGSKSVRWRASDIAAWVDSLQPAK